MTRLKHYINEFWMEMYHKKFEVLENPSVSEIKKLVGKELIRFTLYKKDLYVWEASSSIHSNPWEKAGNSRSDWFTTTMRTALHGVAALKGGKYVMIESDEIDGYLRRKRKEGTLIPLKIDEGIDLKKLYNLFKGNRIINIKPYFKDVI